MWHTMFSDARRLATVMSKVVLKEDGEETTATQPDTSLLLTKAIGELKSSLATLVSNCEVLTEFSAVADAE